MAVQKLICLGFDNALVARLPTKKVTNLIVLERFLVILQVLDLATRVCKLAPFLEAGSFFSFYQHFELSKVHQ